VDEDYKGNYVLSTVISTRPRKLFENGAHQKLSNELP
jgi:hypothetical protein